MPSLVHCMPKRTNPPNSKPASGISTYKVRARDPPMEGFPTGGGGEGQYSMETKCSGWKCQGNVNLNPSFSTYSVYASLSSG